MRRTVLGLLVLLSACQAPGNPAGNPDGTAGRRAADCTALLAAEPQDWQTRVTAVHAHGSAASPSLVAALIDRPTGPGAQAAVALLGRIGDGDAERHLLELMADRGDLATEAALALGALRAKTAAEALVQCATDRFADSTLRTAAATAAVRVGRRRDVADVLRGVMLAGTPTGRELQAELGLPDKPRWAYERYLIQRLIRSDAPDLEMFDTDASWPELERSADRLTAWLMRDP